jgi:hypothetical protein
LGEEGPYFDIPTVPAKTHSAPNSPIRTTLCELIEQADRFHGEFVEVRSEVHPNGVDITTRLIDSSCGAAVFLSVPNESRLINPRNYPVFKRYLEQRRIFDATVSGKFELVLAQFGRTTSVLTVDSVSSIAPKPPVKR